MVHPAGTKNIEIDATPIAVTNIFAMSPFTGKV